MPCAAAALHSLLAIGPVPLLAAEKPVADAPERGLPLDLSNRILDQADVLASTAESRLNDELAEIEDKTSVHMVIMTVDGFDGVVPADFADAMLDRWSSSVGERRHSAILLLSPTERTFVFQLRMAIDESAYAGRPDAYWFEKGKVPPSFAAQLKKIIEPAVVPSFRKGDWEAGLRAGLTAVTQGIRDVEGEWAIEESQSAT